MFSETFLNIYQVHMIKVVTRIKMRNFLCTIHFWEEVEPAWNEIWWILSMIKFRNAFVSSELFHTHYPGAESMSCCSRDLVFPSLLFISTCSYPKCSTFGIEKPSQSSCPTHQNVLLKPSIVSKLNYIERRNNVVYTTTSRLFSHFICSVSLNQRRLSYNVTSV